jgi:putative oxidoreductase
MEKNLKQSKGLAIFIIRSLIGIIFILHGAQKLFGWFGGQGLQGWVNWLATLHVPAFLGYASAIAEFVGGLLLLFGFAAEIGALLEIGVMAGAIVLVHWPHGFFVQNNGFEYALLLMVCCLGIIIGGPGRWHLWNPFKKYE